MRKCHSIGMTPINIENDEKGSCLNSWNTKGDLNILEGDILRFYCGL
jgi:hypothetical protein